MHSHFLGYKNGLLNLLVDCLFYEYIYIKIYKYIFIKKRGPPIKLAGVMEGLYSSFLLNSHQMRMDWNELKWIQFFRNIDSRMLKWMLFNPAFLFIYKICMEHISIPFDLKIILAFSVHNNTIVNTVQFKILNRKCSFSIQLHLIESNWI